MKISRKQFIGSVAVVSAASIAGCTSKLSAETPVDGYGPIEANSPLMWLPETEIKIAGDAARELTSFIDLDYGIHNSYWKDTDGWAIKIKPTGYRGMALWSVSKITVKLDGQEIDQNHIMFNIHNCHFKVNELQEQYGAQWYNFDWATLFIAKPGGLPMGDHEVEVSMTSGTFSEGSSSFNQGAPAGTWVEREISSTKTLPVADTIVKLFW